MKRDPVLLTPGPTPLPREVREALALPIIHHRTDEYCEMFRAVIEGLKHICRTQNEVYTFASSGTGAMEASMTNFLSPGDPVLVLTAGKWGERFAEIAASFSLASDCLKAPYGETFNLTEVETRLGAKPYQAVYATLCETSTGVAHDIEALGKLVRKTEALFVVDAVSGLLCDPLESDAWGVDVVVAGSQKGLMLPPGLAFISVSGKARSRMAQATLPRYYFDLARYAKAQRELQTPFTPAISLIVALKCVLDRVRERGLEAILARAALLAKATRNTLEALGLEIFSKRHSNGLTAVKFPAAIDGKKMIKALSSEHGVIVAGGQGEMKGRIFRIAHMGAISEQDLSTGLDAVEKVLTQMGYRVREGNSAKVFKKLVTV